MDHTQFYPTPKTLGRRAWGLFQNRRFVRVLEPHAGNGDLALQAPWPIGQPHQPAVDACEIDITRHPRLRAAGINVVGVDFLEMQDGACYTHIICNPPFAEGVTHVLKAWELAWDAEIVAILNAETIRNPHTKERRMLVGLVQQHGTVEFLQDTFLDPDAQRKTDVEVALIYLRKRADIQADIVGSILKDLKQEAPAAERFTAHDLPEQQVTVNTTSIENAVTAFNAALRAAREAVFAMAAEQYYARLLGDTMEQRNGQAAKDQTEPSRAFVMTEMHKRHEDLKNRAWTSILRSSQVLSRLSSAAQRRMEHEFETIKSLEFTVSNVFGFLKGVANSQGEIQIAMACDVFDLFTKHHTDNIVFYRGWKSNDKHRTCGLRLKTTRFVLGGHTSNSWRSGADWNTLQMLRDVDKVFAMLDGKQKPEIGLAGIFENNFTDLRAGQRISGSYLDVRYYPTAGTIHFFPTNKTLIDRLNRLVGRHRQWLPPEDVRVSDAFWLQYEQAEQLDKKVRATINGQARGTSRWDHPEHAIHSEQAHRKGLAADAISSAIDSVLGDMGISLGPLATAPATLGAPPTERGCQGLRLRTLKIADNVV